MYGDDVEWLMVVKGYSLAKAKETIIRMVRPICQSCHKPIKGGREGDLFHKSNQYKSCHLMYVRYKRLRRQGLTRAQALDTLRSQRH